MNSQRTPNHSTIRLTRLRRTRWFSGMLLVAVLCTVGLYTLEFAHHHETPAAELHCPICQVMAHGALDVFSPTFQPQPPTVRARFLALVPHLTPVPERVFHVTHRSRAPPLA
ncbi:MAG: hypothetical protein KGJ04_01475 [Gammaproteobacteria bacterium]|nr:hypothetical protein [Gammaproteobacteria bacterium]